MKYPIITISRTHGSGGGHIAKMVADAMGVHLYDRELIALVAQESGYSLEFVRETGEYASTTSLLFDLSAAVGGIYGTTDFMPEHMPLVDRVMVVQNKVIRDIAERESCVIIGRSADYILRDRSDCLKVFIHAEPSFRIAELMCEEGVDEKQAERMIAKEDKLRAHHYRHYTGRRMGEANNYDLCLNTSFLGIEHCRDIILYTSKG